MAQKTIIQLEDDIDGTEADETVAFALDGTNYEMDLTSENADALRGVLDNYTAKARKVGKAKSSRKAAAAPSGPAAAEVRAWAKDNGHNVSDRGRIPAEVRRAFDSAN